MRYRTLGDSGLLVSVVGLGCNNFGGRLDTARTRAVVDAAIDEGITLLDTAETYGGNGASELALGEVLKGRRDKVVLATKFGHQGADMGYGPAAGAKGGRSYIKVAVEKSLTRLQTDYIDLYQLHTPDPVTPIDETLAALDDLVTEGKVRYLGHSNFAGWQIADAAHTAVSAGRTPFISAQNHWSLLERGAEKEVVPAARHFGVGVLPYFPLANGLLTGKVRQGPGHPGELPPGRAPPGRLRHRRQARQGGGPHRLGPGAGRLHPGDRHRRPGRPARLLLSHRGRDLPRPGKGQRGRGRVGSRPKTSWRRSTRSSPRPPPAARTRAARPSPWQGAQLDRVPSHCGNGPPITGPLPQPAGIGG